MKSLSDIPDGKLPQPIAVALRRLIHRVRFVVLVRGISAVIATAAAALLAIMAVDASITLFSDWPRWALTLSALGATIASALWFLILPMARTITMTGIARAIEERHPELQERISSAVELLTSTDMPEIRGSEALIQALAREASEDAAHVRPRAEVSLRAARPYLMSAFGALVIFAALFAIYPNAAHLLLRAVAPYLNLPNIRADQLRVTPGDAVVAEGQRLQVDVEVENPLAPNAQFRKLLPDGSESVEPMTALAPADGGNPRFALTCSPAAESFRYRVHSGDALTRYFDVTVVPPPVVKRMDITYEYPKYTKRDVFTETDASGQIKAVVGTTVTVAAVTNKPVKAAEVRINGQPAQDSAVQIGAGPDGATVCTFKIRLTPRLRGHWSLGLRDEYGFTNSSGERVIEAMPDAPPVVKIVAPENRKLRLKPTDRLPVAYAMTDDYGLSGAEFAIETDTHRRKAVEVPLPPPQGAPVLRAAAGDAPLQLAALPLQGAKQFTFRMRATDSLPADSRGPQEGFSETVTVELDLSAESYAIQIITAEEEAIRKALEKILAELKKSKEDSVPLKDAMPKAQTLTADLTQRVDRMRGHLGAAKGTVADLLPKVAEGTFSGLMPKMNALASEVGSANDRSGQIKLTDAAQERGTLAVQTDQHIDRAIALVLELLKQLDEMATAARLAESLQELADRQAELAAAKAEMEQGAAEQAASPADWQKAENQVAADMGNQVKNTPEARQAQLAQDQQKAKDLAAEARKLEQQQLALAQDTKNLNQVQQTDKALKSLAAEQAALAKEAGGEKIAADQAKPMGEAAKNIEGGALPKAIEQQKAAETALAQRAAQQPAGEQPSAKQPGGEKAGGEKAGGEKAGGEKAGGEKAGGEKAGGEKAGGEKAGGEKAGGEKAGGEKAGGEKAGGEKAGGEKAGGEKAGGEKAGGEKAGGEKAGGEKAGGEKAGGEKAGGEKAGGEKAGGEQPSAEEAQKAGALAAKQADIRQRTEALLAQRQQAAAAMDQAQMNRLQAEQAQLAQEAAKLAQDVQPAGTEAAQTGQEAASDAQAAAKELPSNIGAAARDATKAGQELGALAQNLGKQAGEKAAGEKAGGEKAGGEKAGGEKAGGEKAGGEKAGGEKAGGEKAGGQEAGGQESGGQEAGGQGTPSPGQLGQMAQQAGDLAQRQQALAQEMQALAAGNPQQALAAEQGALEAQTAQLAQETAALGQRAQAMAPQTPAGQQAAQATQSLNQATGAENAAEQALGAGRPENAAAPQAAAANALEAAANALSSLGQTLAAAASPSPAPTPMGQAMAEAFSATSEAAQSQTAAAAAEAAQAMAEAAGQAMAKAQAMGAEPGMAGMMPGKTPSPAHDSKKGIGAVGINLTAAKLERMGIKLSDWARLPGELRNQILQAAEEAGPEEYRSLIKRYFQQVAKRGSAETEGGK